MKRLTFILGFLMMVLTACPQKPDQTFIAPVLFEKSATFLDSIKFKDGTFLLTAPTGTGGSVYWNDILSKPSLFPPENHTHDLLYKPLLWKADWNTDILNKQSTYPPSAHDHNLLYKPINWHETWLDLLSKPSTFPPSAHTHPWTDVTAKPTEVELSNELPLLNGWELPQKSTTAINAMVIPKNKVVEVWDSTLGVKKVWTKGVWKTYITNQ